MQAPKGAVATCIPFLPIFPLANSFLVARVMLLLLCKDNKFSDARKTAFLFKGTPAHYITPNNYLSPTEKEANEA